MPAAAYAQSTGTVEAENKAIVITGSRAKDVGGVTTPDTPKAKVVLTQEIISRSNPGQTILDTINLVPGVSFQNNDAYGSSGGTLNIRGFDSTRISLTFDGIQLNDSGNYAIFSNQQIDPELIEQVNVNLGSTDVDSPTASAVGGTVNYRTMTPTKDFGVRINAGFGDWKYWRLFGVVNTGEIGPFHTRAWFAASRTKNRLPFNNYGRISKQQYNGKIWQPIGSNGDFVSISGHYNQNRNNFFGSLPLRQDLDIGITNSAGDRLDRLVGPNANNRYPRNRDERFYSINFPCQVDTPQAGAPDQPAPAPFAQASCGTEFDRRYNPSNTGNVRIASKFTITDGVVLTVDPSYQYVKANGGGTVTGREGFATFGGAPHTGFIAGNYWFGQDLNGDGDVLDTCVSTATGGCTTATNQRGVTLLAPSQTHTDRYGVIAGLRWDFAQGQMVRVSYTLDDAHHRQTGEVGLLQANGEPVDVFPINDPLRDANGNLMEKRDRKSQATLNQFSGEYRGDFFDNKLTVNVGIRAPFFVRKLHNFCFTTSASGFFDCFGQDAAQEAAYHLAFPAIQGPQKRKFKYDKLLPNLGLIYDITNQLSVFGNYSKGLSVPSTDNLYNSFFFAPDTEQAKPKPEVTDSFDGGLRYRRANIQAQISGWYTHFTNRQAQAFDPELQASVFRNLGTVNKWGIDGSIAYEPVRQLTLYAFGSWNKSKIQDNIQVAQLPLVDPLNPTGPRKTCDDATLTFAELARGCALTKGNRESGSPKYTYGVSAVGDLGPITLGIEAKRTGPRFIFDNNQAMFRGDVDCPGTVAGGCPATTPLATPQVVFGKTAPAYWLVNLDARVKLDAFSPSLKDTYLQLNVYNLFDKFYVGGFTGGLSQSINAGTGVWGNPPFVQIGAPRTVSASINVQF